MCRNLEKLWVDGCRCMISVDWLGASNELDRSNELFKIMFWFISLNEFRELLFFWDIKTFPLSDGRSDYESEFEDSKAQINYRLPTCVLLDKPIGTVPTYLLVNALLRTNHLLFCGIGYYFCPMTSENLTSGPILYIHKVSYSRFLV